MSNETNSLLIAAESSELRSSFQDLIPEHGIAARHLYEAVTAHQSGDCKLAAELLCLANMKAIRDWTKTLWVGKRPRRLPPTIDKAQRKLPRMPGAAMERELFLRDGHHCYYCGIPVIRKKVREALRNLYPNSVPWAGNADGQHAAFQGMQAVCDHLRAHSRGGETTLENMAIACAPCNNGRECWTPEELGLKDPSTTTRIRSAWDGPEPWDGLERLLSPSQAYYSTHHSSLIKGNRKP